MEDPGPESVFLLGEGGEQGAQSAPASLLCPSRRLLLELESPCYTVKKVPHLQ